MSSVVHAEPVSGVREFSGLGQEHEDELAGYLDFFDASPIGFMSLDREGRIVRINRAGRQLLGVAGRASGRRFESYVSEADRSALKVFLSRVIETRARQCCQIRLIRQQGHEHSVLIDVQVSSSRPECHLVITEVAGGTESSRIFQDIQDNLESTLYALPDIVFETGLDGQVHQAITSKGHFPFAAERLQVMDAILKCMSQEADVCRAAVLEANENGRAQGHQCRLELGNEVKWFELSISRKGRVYPDGPHFLVLARDISNRKRAEALLSQNQTLLQSLSKATPLVMCSATAKGDCFHVNDGWREISGRSPDAALGDGWIQCIYSEDRERVSALWAGAVRDGAKFEAEYRLLLPEGGVRWVHCQGIPEKSAQGEVLAYVGLIIDITQRMTERDQLEQMVHERTNQLLTMVMELTTTEERERQALSQELHDGLAQRLAIAKLKLSALIPDKQCRGYPCGLLEEMESLVDEANEVVRSLSLQLSAPMLHEFGLMSGLEWLADEMYRSYGLSVIIGGDGVPAEISHTILNQVYRAVRELLINVGKHARCDIAEVNVSVEDQCLTVSVADSGVGFDPGIRVAASTKGGYGLFGVRQRMGFIGGDIQIDSHLGDGTLIVLSVPLEPAP